MTQAADSQKPVIFAVDDEQANLDVVIRTLNRGYDVRAFTSPTEALTAARATPPAMMIVDHRMPDMTGVQLVRQLRSAGVECATLMLTAFPELLEVVDAEREKLFFQVIPKPWKPEDLLCQVDLALKSFRLSRAIGRLGKMMGDRPDSKKP